MCCIYVLRGAEKLMLNRQNPEQTFWGALLVGLAILFLTNWWFPGILFVIGGAFMAKIYAEGKTWSHPDARNPLIVLVVGAIFAFGGIFAFLGGSLLPIVLIIVGAYLLFGNQIRKRG
jgi:Mg/Co/Ni transporter MgtE